jgi:hypothetical protein
MRQFLNGKALRGVMTRQNEGQSVCLGGQAVMETRFTGEEHIGRGVFGMLPKVASGSANNRHALNGLRWFANPLHQARMEGSLHRLSKRS